jgi:flagellar biosynthesis/type III secretory pathway protein FliH
MEEENVNELLTNVMNSLMDIMGNNLNTANNEGMHYEDICSVLEDCKNARNVLGKGQIEDLEHDLEAIKRDSYDSGFDHGLNEGKEETEEAVHSHIEDFTKFACEIVNYGNSTEKHYFTDKCSEAQSYEDLPTNRMEII